MELKSLIYIETVQSSGWLGQVAESRDRHEKSKMTKVTPAEQGEKTEEAEGPYFPILLVFS